MFEEEMQELENLYKESLKELSTKIELRLPMLTYYMEDFVGIYKQKAEVALKLTQLQEKMLDE